MFSDLRKHGQIAFAAASLVAFGGCATTMNIELANAPVDELPLLVRFAEEGDHLCPKAVIQSVESCSASTDMGKVCRKRNEKIEWLAVTGDAAPFQSSTQRFDIEFGPDPDNPPNPPNPVDPLKDPTCKKSSDGYVACKIRSDAAGAYYYKVVTDHCELDPRIYVQ